MTSDSTIKLPESLTIFSVPDIKDQFNDSLQYIFEHQLESLNFDGENLEDIDASGLQLLISISEILSSNNKQLSITNLPQEVYDIVVKTGANNYFYVINEGGALSHE